MDVDAATVSEGADRADWRERGGGLNDAERKKRRDKGRYFPRMRAPGSHALKLPEEERRRRKEWERRVVRGPE